MPHRPHSLNPVIFTLLLLPACGDDGLARPSSSASEATLPDLTTGDTGASPAATEPASTITGSSTAGIGPTEGTSTLTTGTGSTTSEPICTNGTIVCEGNISKVCDGLGELQDEQVCENMCVPGIGCTLCVPGAADCDGDKVLVCNAEGSAKDVQATCDGVQGVVCDANLGACAGACANLGASYIGCDYYPTVLQQVDAFAINYQYAVAISNTSDKITKVTITRGANMILQQEVAANSLQIIPLPWVNELIEGQGPSVLVKDGAYRLRSDNPVTVYQYNPLQATSTNDASLLLPVNTWTGNYLVASWPYFVGDGITVPGFYAVVAREDGTTVTLTPSATGKNVQAGGGVAADGTGVVMLDGGDVLEVMNSSGDLTGTMIAADKPVQVFGGHECTNVPLNIFACDHLEESIFPIETLAKEYLVVPPVQVSEDTKEKAQVVRVIASEANTTLEFTPDQPVAKVLAKAGDYVELASTTAKFRVAANKKILVSQYMVGQGAGFGLSDPAMVLAVNPLQWRNTYLVHAPTTWVANYADLTAKTGTQVTVDGIAASDWQAIGNTGYSFTHVRLSNNGNGNHSIAAKDGVGVSIYGVQEAGSYWYPGGLDLDVIPQ